MSLWYSVSNKFYQVHQKSCKGLTVKVVPSSSTSTTPLVPPLLPNSNNQPPQQQNNNSTVPNPTMESNLDLFSPSLNRRTLHSQDDTVVSNTGPNYQETIIKQMQKTDEWKRTNLTINIFCKYHWNTVIIQPYWAEFLFFELAKPFRRSVF